MKKLRWGFKHLIHLLSLTRQFSPSTISIWNAFVWKLNSRRLNQKQPPSACLRNPSSNSLSSFPTLFALPRWNGKVTKNLPILRHRQLEWSIRQVRLHFRFEYKVFADLLCCRPFLWTHLAWSRSHTPTVGLHGSCLFHHSRCQLPRWFFHAFNIKIHQDRKSVV